MVCSATDSQTTELVAIKKIGDIFGHVADARCVGPWRFDARADFPVSTSRSSLLRRILREIKLLRMLKHTNIVELKHILLPPSSRNFKEIFLVFELMESDLHQVIKINHDLTPEHLQYFLYQARMGSRLCLALLQVCPASPLPGQSALLTCPACRRSAVR